MDPSFWVALIKGIIFPLLGIFILGKYNIFEDITFVPKEYAFEVGLTTYFVFLEFIYLKVSNYIDLYCKASIKCLFYSDIHLKKLSNIPIICFVEDVSYINCSISLKGGVKKLINNSLIISFPDWVEIQETNGSVGDVNEKNQLIINFNKIISKDSKIEEGSTVDIRIGMIRNLAPDKYSNIIVPTISKKRLAKFSFNKFELHN